MAPQAPELPDFELFSRRVRTDDDEANPAPVDARVLQLQQSTAFTENRESRNAWQVHEKNRLFELYFSARSEADAEEPGSPLENGLASRRFRQLWPELSKDVYNAAQGPEKEITVGSWFVKELVSKWLPLRCGYDSWIGKEAIQKLCLKHNIPLAQVHDLKKLTNDTGDLNDLPSESKEVAVCREIELKSLGPLVYLPKAGDKPLTDLEKQALEQAFTEISNYLILLSESIWEWLLRYVLHKYSRQLDQDDETDSPHGVLENHMLEAYCYAVLGYRWFEGPFKDLEFVSIDKL